MKLCAPAIFVLILSACVVGPNYQRPAALNAKQAALHEMIANSHVSAKTLPVHWWHLFDDPELDRLVEKALVYNTDLRVAVANLQRARAVLSESGAALLPTSDVTTQAVRRRTSAAAVGSNGTINTQAYTTNYFVGGFDTAYEINLFGGVTRLIQSARADVDAAAASVNTARVSVAAETARAYAQACGYGAQAAVARETKTLQLRTLDLTERRRSAGRGTRSEVDQAITLVEQAAAQVPVFEANRRSALYALAVLTGDAPNTIFETSASLCHNLPIVKSAVPVGDGQALLARRPDVRQAERQLAGDVARIGIATAALYPSIRLLGSTTLGATQLSNLGNSSSFGYTIGPSISWAFPFNGALRARVRETNAVSAGSLAKFDGAVLTALKETEQSLARLDGAVQRELSLGRALTASSDAARLSRLRFDNGADSFLQLIDAERTRATARAALAQASADRADGQISLFKALGGGWEDAPTVVEKKFP